jgi:pSer/pThr/pTyr-binding forkhead associated (FHA) protein
MFKLVIQDDEGKTTVVPLIRDEITIGRKEGNTIRLTERNVSRRHARILRNNGEVQIEDLGSYNGIRVNNARIAERVSLRVSDQVQIGDYKLYLKAEGVEQVDDARTMPIERVDNAQTDVMSAVAPPTTPMGVPSPTPVPGTVSVVGIPNRTLVAISDTDPQGRPVATAAVVAALSATAGYGKLVVLSSNFAGKEFELSRPQMIIGRTDENDIVINHRSISRNHAKLVREPETGRYTISDLQSSNGVRVNGQDYGKVELRRGDVIDLGHVRLRFVEPGEDFVFARDAVITDVPDVGGRRGLVLVLVLGVIVVGVIVAVFMMRSKDKPAEGGASGAGGGTGIASGGGETPDAPQIAVNPPVTVDAAEDNPVTPPPAIDAPPATNPGSSELEIECRKYQSDGNWADLDACAERLKAANSPAWKELKNRAVLETKAGPRINAFEVALRERNLKNAKAELDKIPNAATSYAKLRSKYDQAEAEAIREVAVKLERVNSGDCKEYNVILQQERQSKPPRVAAEAARQVKCSPATAPPCNHEELAEKGKDQFGAGQLAAALSSWEAAWNCKQDPAYAEKAFIIACNLPNVGKAKLFWKRMSSTMKQRALMICVRNQITEDMLNAP